MPARPSLRTIAGEAAACVICAPHLPHAPRPVFRVDARATIVVIGQAPGARVHESGVPWADDSGDHLREWLGIDRAAFDSAAIALLPMGFCWPGRRSGGDLPPRPECAPAWHERLLAKLPRVGLRLLVGQYAIDHYLGDRARGSLAETVRSFRAYLPGLLPLPHPSWRSKIWMGKNPWFAAEVLPVLRETVRQHLA